MVPIYSVQISRLPSVQLQVGFLSLKIVPNFAHCPAAAAPRTTTEPDTDSSPKKEQTTLKGWFIDGVGSSGEPASTRKMKLEQLFNYVRDMTLLYMSHVFCIE